MKRQSIIIAIGLLILSWACSDDDKQQIPVIKPEAQGVFKDETTGFEFPWVRYGNLEWMTTNLQLDVKPDDWTSNGC